MIEHIVKNNESIYDILDYYHISIEELKEYNPHITNIRDLTFGMKVRIPIISNECNQILDSSEILVEDFYRVIEDKLDTNENSIDKDLNLENKKNIFEKNEEKISTFDEKNNINDTPILSNRCYPGILPPKKRYGGR